MRLSLDGAFTLLRIISGGILLMCFVYQSLGTLWSYLKFPTAMDAAMEGLETLRFPGISICITNWINKTHLCTKYKQFCNFSEAMVPRLRELLDTEGNLGDIAANHNEIIQTTFEDPSLYYYRFVYDERQISQTYSRLPKYMCYTLNWRGNNEMNSYHEYPPLFEFTMYVQWKLEQQVVIDEFELTMGFHSVEVINAGEVHSMILHPNGNYEFSTEMSVTRLLPPPYDTSCVHYERLGHHPLYPAYMSQTLCNFECQREITRSLCNCTPPFYPFRNKLSENVCDHNVTAECVQTRSKTIYNKECPKRCRSSCEEVSYQTIQGYSGHDNGTRSRSLRFVNVKIIMPTRHVNILRAVPQLTGSSALAIFGGYLGIWLGLSVHDILRPVVFTLFQKVIRLTRGVYEKLTLACLGRCFIVFTFVNCAILCGQQAFHDVHLYRRYPGQVQHLQKRMTGVRFPSLSLCLEKGYNLSQLCKAFPYMDCEDMDGQRIIGAYLEETKTLLRFSYPRKLIVYSCDFISEDPTCPSFPCHDAWEPAFTRYIDNICWTFDIYRVTNKPGHPMTECQAPWKYYLKTTFSANIRVLKDRPFISGILHEPGTTGASTRPTMRFRAAEQYRIAVFQTDSSSLPPPYESACTDYTRLTKISAYSDRRLHADECAERCLMDRWVDACQCISKLYALKHLLKAPMCDIFSHVQCTSLMRTNSWRQSCLEACTLPCQSIRYLAVPQKLRSRLKNASRPNEIGFEIRMATDVNKIVHSSPRIEFSELISFVEGHIGLWLGVSIVGITSQCITYFGNSFMFSDDEND